MEFSELNLPDYLVSTVAGLGYEKPTFIQEKAIPALLSGKDVIAQSETGSGKTAAFALPIISKATPGQGVQCLVLAPTRELAEQVAFEFRRLSRNKKLAIAAVYGGVDIEPQISALRRSEIIVATPGRMLDHLSRRTADFRRLQFLVLDEADKMFEMGFIDDVRRIIKTLPRERQTMLFSATIGPEVRSISSEYMKAPHMLRANPYVDKGALKQLYYDVRPQDKFSILLHLISEEKPGLSIVFCATRSRVDTVTRNLTANGINAVAIHGGHTQAKRNAVMRDVRTGKVHILVATDVAARGLDIRNVSHVFNYDIPKTSVEYVHRIGRTARAGKSGKAISILAEADHENFRHVMEDRSLGIQRQPVPSFRRVQFIMPKRDFSRNFPRRIVAGYSRRR